jgi:predicted aldo/keto reductase-like oxidoreductase
MTDGDRRKFLKTGLAGLAGAAALPATAFGGPEEKDEKKPEAGKKEKLPTRTLGRTGLELPVVNMGVMNAESPALVKAALDSGMLLLDTAHYYQRGRNEEMVGEVVKDIPRESFYVATKGRPSAVDRAAMQDADQVPDETTESFVEKLDLSLKRLGLDYVDILYQHSAKSAKDAKIEPIVMAMEKLKKDGKIRFIGISTHRNEPEVIRAAIEMKIYDVIEVAYNFRQRHRKEVGLAIAEAAKAGIGIVAMKTQAGVYWDRDRTKKIDMKAALKWVLQDKNVHTAIPGFTTFDQLEEDLAVMADLELSPKEKEALDLGEVLGMPGLYCPGCGECRAGCARGLDIPSIMRSYMYAYGYRNLGASRAALAACMPDAGPCDGCTICGVKCPQGFDVREKIADIARLRDVPAEFVT